MGKFPLESTISGSYRFLFSNFVSIVGIVWLPYLVFGGLIGGVIVYAVTHYSLAGVNLDPKHLNIVPLYAFFHLLPLIIFLATLAELIVTVGLVRKALGLTEGTTFVFFSLGAPVWRLLAAFFLVYLIMVGIICMFAAVGFAWAMFGQSRIASIPLRVLIDALGILIMTCAFFYIAIRLVFFVPAVVVAENRIGIGRAWALGGGNFWRIVVVVLMVVLPPAIAFGMLNSVVSEVVFGPMPMAPFAGNPHPDPQQVIAFYKVIFARLWSPAIIAIQLLSAVVIRALYAGAIANAYRSVVPAEAAPAA